MSFSNIQQKEMERAADKLASVNSFIQRNYWLWVAVAFLIYPLAAVYSAFTEGGHVYIRVLNSSGSHTMAVIVTAVLVVLIESIAYFTGKTGVDDIQGGAFVNGGPDRAMLLVKLAAFVGVSILSYNLSTKGAEVGTKWVATKNTPPTLVSLDSINAMYDERAAPYLANVEAFRNTKWRGSITRDAVRGMKEEGARLEQLEADRRAALAAADAENVTRLSIWENETAETGSWMGLLAGVGEVIKAICLIFIGIYDQGVMREAKRGGAKPGQGPTSTPPGGGGHAAGASWPQGAGANPMLNQIQPNPYTATPPTTSTPTPTPGATRPIGFFLRDPEPPTPPQASAAGAAGPVSATTVDNGLQPVATDCNNPEAPPAWARWEAIDTNGRKTWFEACPEWQWEQRRWLGGGQSKTSLERGGQGGNHTLKELAQPAEYTLKLSQLLGAWKDQYKQYQAYHRDSGSPEANAAGRARHLALMEGIEKDIAALGSVAKQRELRERRMKYAAEKELNNQ